MTATAAPAKGLSRGNVVRLVVLAAIWGASFLFIKLSLEQLTPVQIVLGRLTGGALALLAVVAVRRQGLPREPRLWHTWCSWA